MKVQSALHRLVAIVGTIGLLLPLAIGQGSAQGYGQGAAMGGPGGGMGGGAMGSRMEADMAAPKEKAKLDQAGGYWDSKSAILTPGDRVEFKFKLDAGTSLICGVETDAFDAALEFLDEAGTTLAKNDDRAEGAQAPFLAYRAKKSETITVRVLSFRSAAGGRFLLNSLTSPTLDVSVGTGTGKVAMDSNRPLLLRFEVKKGRYYDFTQLEGFRSDLNPRNRAMLFVNQIIGPSGIEDADGQMISQVGGGRTLFSNTDGALYLQVTSQKVDSIQWTAHEIEAKSLSKEGEATVSMPDGRLHVYEFPVSKRELLKTRFAGNQAFHVSWEYPQGGQESFSDETQMSSSVRTLFRPMIGNDRELVQLFHEEGSVKVFLRSYASAPIEAKITNTQKLTAWEEGKALTSDLAIGESKFYTVKSTQSELMRIALQAKGFAPQMDIFTLNGGRANSMTNRSNLRIADDLYYPTADTFLIRVSCMGSGGSGSFSLVRSTLRGPIYKLGVLENAVIDEKRFGLFEVELEAGKWYEFLHDTTGKPMVQVDLLDGEGNFLQSTNIQFDKMNRRFFRANISGKHRLWIRGPFGSYPFKIIPYASPELKDK